MICGTHPGVRHRVRNHRFLVSIADQPHLPAGAVHVRSTPEFDATSTPPGLRRAHQIAEGVWGVLRVLAGTVTFVLEESGTAIAVAAGDHHVIEPESRHHVVVADDARFVVDFHRVPD